MKKIKQPVLAVNYLKEALALLETIDCDTDELCRTVGIQRELLENNEYIPLSQLREILAYTREHIGDKMSGIVFGSNLGISTHSFAGLAVASQPTLGSCMRSFSEVLEFRFPAIAAHFISNEHGFGLRITEVIPLGQDLEFIVETIFASFHRMMEKLSAKEFKIQHVNLSYPAPNKINSYYKIFGSRVIFNAAHCEYWLPISVINEPTTHYDPVAATLSMRKLQDDTPEANKNILPKSVLSILEQAQGRIPPASKVASKLAMSERTLRRKLSFTQTSYQQLLNLFKRNKAVAYLRETEKSVTEISTLLDYQDSSHFSKAFKDWTGYSPSQFRKMAR